MGMIYSTASTQQLADMVSNKTPIFFHLLPLCSLLLLFASFVHVNEAVAGGGNGGGGEIQHAAAAVDHQPSMSTSQQTTADAVDDSSKGNKFFNVVKQMMPSGQAEKRVGKWSRLGSLSKVSTVYKMSMQKQKEYVEQEMEQYGQPETISRLVKADKLGQLHSKDKSMQAILDYVQAVPWWNADVRKEMMTGMPGDGCFLSFSINSEEVNPQAWLFDVGTQVSIESLEGLELFEERETGRKMMRKKEEAEENSEEQRPKKKKKGQLMEHHVGQAMRGNTQDNGGDRAKRDVDIVVVDGEGQAEAGNDVVDEKMEDRVEEEEEKEEEEEEEEDEEAPIKLGTYAILMAIQRGRRGLGPEATLDWSKLPESGDNIKDARLRAAVDKFFNAMIEAASPAQKGNNEGNEGKEEEKKQVAQFAEKTEDHHIASFLNKVHENDVVDADDDNDGSDADGRRPISSELDAELNGLMQKMVASVREASDTDRADILALASLRLEEVRKQDSVDQEARAKLAAERQHAYDFMRSVRFTIGGRPGHKAFKKLTEEHFQELVSLAGKHSTELEALINGAQSAEHRALADALLHAIKGKTRKAAETVWDAFKTVGEMVGKLFGAVNSKLHLVKSKEQTSGEKREQEREARTELRKVDVKRREKLRWAVEQVRKSSQCHLVLGPRIARAVYPGKEEEEHGQSHQKEAQSDLHARLGAQALNAVLNTKRFTEGHSIAVAMSVGGSGLIGIVLDVMLVPLIVWGMAGTAGPLLGTIIVKIIRHVLKPLMESATPLVAETFDSAIIKQYLDMLKGKKFWRGMKHFQNTLKEAIPSGKIAAVGSLALNFSLCYSILWPLSMVLNVVSTFTSAFMVPLELQKTMEHTVKAIYKKQAEGFFPTADPKFKRELVEKTQKEMEAKKEKFWGRVMLAVKKQQRLERPVQRENAAYIAWLEREAWRSMEVEQSSRLAINSMGIGPIVSTVVFLLMLGIQTGLPIIPEAVINAVSVMFNSPTEMISMTGAILGANSLGWEQYPHLLSNDEQKNAQIMGLIFERSSAQRKSKNTAEVVEISEKELHRIYNPWLGVTMRLGKGFVYTAFWMKRKWDRWASREEYRMKQIEGGTDKLDHRLVANFAPNIVYLITFPRTSSAQSLSPKTLALELWLKMLQRQKGKNLKIKFYRICDGIFMRALNAEAEIPFLEFNGKQFRGTLEEIQAGLFREMKAAGMLHHHQLKEIASGKAQFSHLIEQFQTLLHTLRHQPDGIDFLINDQGLVTELISTLSQLYPKLVDYEMDFVDSWDTLPWQLKRAFTLMLINPKGTKKLQLGIQTSSSKIASTSSAAVLSPKKLLQSIEDVLKQSGGPFLHGSEPTLMDATLFGLLAQFFEKPEEHRESAGEKVYDLFRDVLANPESKLAKFYGNILHTFVGGEAQWKALKEQPLALLNYDFEHTPDTDKYGGQFSSNFGQQPAAGLNHAHQLMEIRNIIGELEVNVEAIKLEMREEKVDHPFFGSWLKSQRQWTPEQFERELHARLEQKRRELYRADVGKKVLRHYPPTMAAVADRLLDVVWNWATLAEKHSTDENNASNDALEGAERVLGTALSTLVIGHMEARGYGQVIAQTGPAMLRAFREQHKAGELVERAAKAKVLRLLGPFYAGQLRLLVLALFNGGAGGNKKGDHNNNDHKKKVKEEARRERLRPLLEHIKPDMTYEGLEERVHFVYNLEVSELLKQTLDKIKEKKIEPAVFTLVNQVFGGEKPAACVIAVLTWQAKAMNHIEQNCDRISKDKRRRALVERMERMLARFASLDREMTAECKRRINGLEMRELDEEEEEEKRKKNRKNEEKKDEEEEKKKDEEREKKKLELKKNVNKSNDALTLVKKFNSVDLYKEMRQSVEAIKNDFETKMKALNKERAARIEQVLRVYELNAQMRAFMEARIGGLSVYATLGAKRVENMRQYLRDKIGFLAHAERSHDLNPKPYKLDLDLIEAELTDIGTLQAEALGQLHRIHESEGKAKLLEKVGKTHEKYAKILEIVDKKINPTNVRVPDKKAIMDQLKEQVDQVGAILAAIEHAVDNNVIKHLISNELDTVKKSLKENVQRKMNFLTNVLWSSWRDRVWKQQALVEHLPFSGHGGEMTQAEAEQKQLALDGLIAEVRADEQLNELGALLHTCDQIVLNFHGTAADESAANFLAHLQEQLELQGAQGVAKKRLLDEISRFYERERVENERETLAEIKYLMAKALLHLSAVYLCQDKNNGKDCAKEHLALAGQQLQQLSGKIDITKLLTDVKHVVYHAIADFNENYLIREAILHKYGLPLKNELDRIDDDESHWDVDNFVAALSPDSVEYKIEMD